MENSAEYNATTTNNGADFWNEVVSEQWLGLESMLEIALPEPDDFLKVIETLTRIGIESRGEKKLTQTCHILHKRGKFYIMHFKELFLLDGKRANFTRADLYRRNTIAALLEEWDLIEIVNPAQIGEEKFKTLRQIKILPFSQKGDYELVAKYQIGGNK